MKKILIFSLLVMAGCAKPQYNNVDCMAMTDLDRIAPNCAPHYNTSLKIDRLDCYPIPTVTPRPRT